MGWKVTVAKSFVWRSKGHSRLCDRLEIARNNYNIPKNGLLINPG